MGVLERFMGLNLPAQAGAKKVLTHRVVLGALLSLVSQADGQVSPAEVEAKKKVLGENGFKDPREQAEILEASQRALADHLDWEGFTREVNEVCEYEERVKLVRELFSVAWADHELADAELEAIRKISNLLWVDHKDFINAKLETKPKRA